MLESSSLSPGGQAIMRCSHETDPGLPCPRCPMRRHPFKLPSGEFVTSRDVVDINNQLGMDYSLGSFDKVRFSVVSASWAGRLLDVTIGEADWRDFKISMKHDGSVCYHQSLWTTVYRRLGVYRRRVVENLLDKEEGPWESKTRIHRISKPHHVLLVLWSVCVPALWARRVVRVVQPGNRCRLRR